MMRPQSSVEDTDHHAELLAFWGPFLHLISCGLGWPWPALGISRWIQHGRSRDHPILRVVDDWWGPHLAPFVDWAATSYFYKHYWSIVAEVVASKTGASPSAPPRLSSSGKYSVGPFGSAGDSMHLMTHIAPIEIGDLVPERVFAIQPNAQLLISKSVGHIPRATLLLESYAGWYSTLNGITEQLPPQPSGRSWQVDVVVKPLGWLGTYRQSRQSGRWFSGRHRWHQLGI